MIRSLFSGVSGLRNHQVRMDTLSNNISNVNTTGFKGSRANFQDALSQTLRGGGAGRNPMQAGTGISVSSIGTKMEQGPLQMTGRKLDLAIQGAGFFKITNGIETVFTRDGAFFLDDQFRIVNSNGYTLLDTGDAEINLGGIPSDLSIDKNGVVIANGSPVTTIELWNFPNNEGLEKKGNSMYIQTSASGTPEQKSGGATAMGTIESGYLEMSNVDLSEEFTTMITTQRGYQANSRIITVSDTLLEELIQLKR